MYRLIILVVFLGACTNSNAPIESDYSAEVISKMFAEEEC